VILEDSSGRIRIKPTNSFYPGMVITGSVVALKGEADIDGIFHVEDMVYPGYWQSAENCIPRQLKVGGAPR